VAWGFAPLSADNSPQNVIRFAVLPDVVPIPESHRNVVSLALIQTKGHRKIVSPSDGYSVVKVLLLNLRMLYCYLSLKTK